ncbi:MAG: hypothetical protein QOE82_3675 [Thermoanaerobaculia bacterium]|jgi:hypothetical protein|nr:hypothetical protein [Thermoanaerobaculia bacterium]
MERWRPRRLASLAMLEVYVCCTCGHFQYFVPAEAIEELVASETFSDVV